jgi:hypothetical protein
VVEVRRGTGGEGQEERDRRGGGEEKGEGEAEDEMEGWRENRQGEVKWEHPST